MLLLGPSRVTDDGREVGVERHDESLDVAALRVAAVEAGVRVGREHGGVEEPEQRVRRAVVQEPETADLRSLRRAVLGLEERRLDHAEHPDLRVRVA